MINILFFIESLTGGGAEKVLLNLVNAMDQSRFAVTVQTLYPEVAAAQLAPGIRYKYCYGVKSAVSNIRMRMEAALGLTYPLHIRGEYDIEVAYLECGSTKIMAGSTAQRALKLAWVHCDLAKKADDPAEFARKTAGYYQKFDRVVCVAESVRESFRAMYGDIVKTVTVYNTVDDGEIKEKTAASLPEDVQRQRLTLALVGRLTPAKKIPRALDAHRRLLEDGVDYDLWIIGDGEERSMLERYIREAGLENSARLLGFRQNPYCLMRAADLLVCSSLYEGFSTFITEGLILGKPIVTTECSGMRELLGDSEYGLITANDDEAFYQGLKRMLTEPGLLAHYREKAAARGADFRREKLVRETEKFLTDAWLEKQGR